MAHFKAGGGFVKSDYTIMWVILFLSLFFCKIHEIVLIHTFLSACSKTRNKQDHLGRENVPKLDTLIRMLSQILVCRITFTLHCTGKSRKILRRFINNLKLYSSSIWISMFFSPFFSGFSAQETTFSLKTMTGCCWPQIGIHISIRKSTIHSVIVEKEISTHCWNPLRYNKTIKQAEWVRKKRAEMQVK